MEFHVEDHPDPLDIEVLETQIRRIFGLTGDFSIAFDSRQRFSYGTISQSFTSDERMGFWSIGVME